MAKPTELEQLQARQLIIHLQQIIEPSFFQEALNPDIPEPPNLPQSIQIHLDKVKDTSLPRPARIAAMRALIKIKGGEEP